jgi:UDP-glucose 4-epimerase
MHVIITGGLGFIGSNIASRLIASGHGVSLIDNLSTAATTDVSGAETVHLDLLDDEAAASIDLPDTDCLIHLAGPSSGMEANNDPARTIADGYQVTLNALRLAARLKARRVLNASSMVVYGNTVENPVGEEQCCQPTSHYGIGKYANERLVDMFCTDNGIKFTQLRFFNVYGPGQDLARLGQGLVSIFLALLLKDPKITMKGSPKRFRDIVHIDDVAEACVRCAASDIPNGSLNIGTGQSIVYEDLTRLIADELGILDQFEIQTVEGVSGDLFGIYADISRMKKELDFVPEVTQEQGVRLFTQWAVKQGAQPL